MERLHHPNVIRLYEVVETLAKLHMVMEYAPGGELFTKISNEGKMTESEAKPIFAQVVSALDHMVSNGRYCLATCRKEFVFFVLIAFSPLYIIGIIIRIRHVSVVSNGVQR